MQFKLVIINLCLLIDLILAKKECVFCKRQRTATKGSGYENLVKCVTNAAAETILTFGMNCDVVELVGLNHSNVIAKEFHYHRSCY